MVLVFEIVGNEFDGSHFYIVAFIFIVSILEFNCGKTISQQLKIAGKTEANI